MQISLLGFIKSILGNSAMSMHRKVLKLAELIVSAEIIMTLPPGMTRNYVTISLHPHFRHNSSNSGENGFELWILKKFASKRRFVSTTVAYADGDNARIIHAMIIGIKVDGAKWLWNVILVDTNSAPSYNFVPSHLSNELIHSTTSHGPYKEQCGKNWELCVGASSVINAYLQFCIVGAIRNARLHCNTRFWNPWGKLTLYVFLDIQKTWIDETVPESQ